MQSVGYELGSDGAYIVHGYNRAPAFSSFLSGIAGPWGIPAWAYYVNRGQALCTFGVQDKDHCLMEFDSVRLHQHRAALEGFRTFIVIRDGDQRLLYEPFRSDGGPAVRNRLEVRPHALELVEEHDGLGLEIRVRYATVPDQPFAALARQVIITHRGTQAHDCDIVDGFPRLIPYGESFELLKKLPFVTEGYLEVSGRAEGTPFVRMRTLSSDTWQVEVDPAGHFFRAIDEQGQSVQPIVDQELLFGAVGDFIRPYALLDPAWDPLATQGEVCQTCCAFVHRRVTLAPGATIRIESLYGQARRPEQLPMIAALLQPGYVDAVHARNRRLIDGIRHRCFVHGGSGPLNHYLPQTYLDNVLRGGLPVTLAGPEDDAQIIHLYGRKHGDLERDYNMFRLDATVFSQGDGNFRDVNQNRRHDVWFNPAVGPGNIRRFFNLLQLDGFNPLVVRGTRWHLPDPEPVLAAVSAADGAAVAAVLGDLVSRPFTPGSVFTALTDAGVVVHDREGLLGRLLDGAAVDLEAAFGEGYWCDHWIYNFDHLDSYLAIYPDRLRRLLVEDASYTYHDTDVRVLPRQAKHVLLADGRVAQVDALVHDPAKAARLAARRQDRQLVRSGQGDGPVYRCPLSQKILCLLVNRMASLAPSGIGIEMDGGRPGWNDSINGLPGIFGSSVSEVVHLRRAALFLATSLRTLAAEAPVSVPVPVELASLWRAVMAAIAAWRDDADAFAYWDAANTAKEAFREATFAGLDGAEEQWDAAAVIADLAAVVERLDASWQQSQDPATGLPATYCRHQATAWEEIAGPQGAHPLGRCVRITGFSHRFLPPFLEVPSHALQTGLVGGKEARQLYDRIRSGPLYDAELGMYIVCDSLAGEGPEVGRLWAWAPGWFENENVFLHLEHKYLLGCLHAGLHEAFFADLQRCAIPFQPPERYGRNVFENASFIMSSRQPKPGYRGRGFQPRSSGTTAEVLEMHLHMSFGPQPFTVQDGRLCLSLAPILAPWQFTDAPCTVERIDADEHAQPVDLPARAYAALFLGRCLVVYENPDLRPTFGPQAARPTAWCLHQRDGTRHEISGPTITGPLAEAVRQGNVTRIDCRLE